MMIMSSISQRITGSTDVERLDNLNAWFERIDARPETQAALQLPEPRPSAFGEGDVEAAAKKNSDNFRK